MSHGSQKVFKNVIKMSIRAMINKHQNKRHHYHNSLYAKAELKHYNICKFISSEESKTFCDQISKMYNII